ncbi:hypothetical protein V5799_006196 [Amblyomma americanum]|uniref:Fibronectin type-III domain-containing protein n=1 Tax=Amblyomma americanum TaxID=6943 RepID=A0AAQ4DX33_AMBAM
MDVWMTLAAFLAAVCTGTPTLAETDRAIPTEDASVVSYGPQEVVSGGSRIADLPEPREPLLELSFKNQIPHSFDQAASNSNIDNFKNFAAAQGNAAPVHGKALPKAAHQKAVVKNCTGQCHEGSTTAKANMSAPSAVKNLALYQPSPQVAFYTWERPDIPNGPIDGYIVSTGNLETKKVVITEVPGNTTTLIQKTIEQYTKYKVDVQAYNIANPYGLKQAGPAASVEFESIGHGPVPPMPEVADIYENRVLVNWTEPIDLQHDITYYAVELEKTASSAFTTNSSIWLNGLETWHQYTVLVSSCTSEGKCGPPKRAYFQTDVGTPTTPRQLNSTSVSRYSLGIAWTRPEDAKGPIDGYRVVVTNESLEFEVTTKSTELTLSNLAPSCLYGIAVIAFNNGAHRIKEGPAALIDVKTLYGRKFCWL